MKSSPLKPLIHFAIRFILLLAAPFAAAADDASRLAELDAFWAEVSRSVREGDFEAYKATCHADAVLISGVKKTSEPMSKALERWKQDFDATKAGKLKASVEFRFSELLGDDTTALETGIFLYTSIGPDGEEKKDYIHFEEMLVKRDGWKGMMEYQKSKATAEEWEALE
jgi:hypothetical protein